MAIKRSSVEKAKASGPPNVAASPAEKRGYGVPKEQQKQAGRPIERRVGKRPDGGRAAGERASGNLAVAKRRPRSRWRQRVATSLDLIRANPTGRVALKIFIAVAGAVVVTVGIALIPLPGPGWLLVIAGLGIWAVEFHWARRLLTFTRRHVHGWTQWVTRQSLGVRFVLGAVGLVFVATVVWLSLKYSLGIDLVAQVLRYLATN